MTAHTQLADMENKKGQVVKSAAEIYETFFVPALFGQWPPVIADMLALTRGKRVLDVACGTGIAARYFAQRTGDSKYVDAIDLNEGMLKIARQKAPEIHFQQADVEALPYDENNFDNVFCQFGLMFFQDRGKAIQEMMRVLKPGGKLAVAVWDELEKSPGYKTVVEMLQELFGNHVANEIRAPFMLGDKETLKKVFIDAGVTDFDIHTKQGDARFPTIGEWIFTDIKGWTLADMLNDQQFEQFSHVASDVLRKYTDSRGNVKFAAPAHIVIAEK